MTTNNKPNCLIRQSACSLQSGQTECTKCGIRTDVRYVSQEDMDMAVAKGTALYWQNHAQALQQTLKTQEDAQSEQLERAEIERTKAEAVRVQAQKEKQEAEARRTQEKAQREAAAIKLTGPMVLLPQGRFTMGSPPEDQLATELERPQRKVTIGYQLAIGKFPVTFAKWDAFAAENDYKSPSDDGWGRGNRPVFNVTFEDAVAYVAWINKSLSISLDDPCRFRLPTEAEWEYACRAGTSTRYWWGDEWEPNRANANNDSLLVGIRKIFSKSSKNGPLPVDHFGDAGCNRWGLCDMLGNVLEMTEDFYREGYSGAPCDGRPVLSEGTSSQRVCRGGCWEMSPYGARSASRTWDPKHSGVLANYKAGFRLARTLSWGNLFAEEKFP